MAEKFDGKERRQFVRIGGEIDAKFRVLLDNKNEPITDWIEGKSNNISLGGMCIMVPDLKEELKKMIQDKANLIHIEMNFGENIEKVQINAHVTYVSITGRVKWEHSVSDVYEIGIQFVNPPLHIVEKIKDFIVKQYIKRYKSEVEGL